jgi:hypothetical protein
MGGIDQLTPGYYSLVAKLKLNGQDLSYLIAWIIHCVDSTMYSMVSWHALSGGVIVTDR